MSTYSIKEITEKVTPIFSSNSVKRAILFGSYAKGTQTYASDIDILVESDIKMKGIDFFGLLDDITETLGVSIDLIDSSQLIEGGRLQLETQRTGVVIYEKS